MGNYVVVKRQRAYPVFLIDHVEFLERDELPVARGRVDALALVDLAASVSVAARAYPKVPSPIFSSFSY